MLTGSYRGVKVCLRAAAWGAIGGKAPRYGGRISGSPAATATGKAYALRSPTVPPSRRTNRFSSSGSPMASMRNGGGSRLPFGRQGVPPPQRHEGPAKLVTLLVG